MALPTCSVSDDGVIPPLAHFFFCFLRFYFRVENTHAHTVFKVNRIYAPVASPGPSARAPGPLHYSL